MSPGPQCPVCGLGSGDLEALSQLLRLRWVMRQVVALAGELPGLTDVQLRVRLAALAERASSQG